MKHKVGDKVRIKSKEWYEENKNENGDVQCGETFFVDSMVRYCGNTATITSVDRIYRLDIDESWEWTDEMFEDSTLDNAEKPHISEQLIKDIAEVIKSHNLGVSVSENEGKLIIEPLEEKKEDDLPIDTPVMVADANSVDTFILRYYAGKGKVFCAGHHDAETEGTWHYDIIIPWDKFDPKDLGESMKFNIVK